MIARFFVGLTPGYYNPDITAEDIAEHLDAIRDEEGYIAPYNSGPEIKKVADIVLGKTEL